MDKLSVIIPSREDSYLMKTVNGVLEKAEGDIEVVIVLDGYWPKDCLWEDSRIVIVHHGTFNDALGMRAGINAGVAIAKGSYIMKADEHCMFDSGFDTKLKADCEDNWLVIPRRYRLDADNWKIIEDGRPPIDYMYLENRDGYLHGEIWKERTEERKDILIDDLMTFQGSCWFLKKKFWETIGPMDDANYGPFANEAQELSLKTWLTGGRVVVNKKTWYAHWHRDRRGYGFTNEQQRKFNEDVAKGRAYCYNYWINTKDYKYDFNWLINKFPIISDGLRNSSKREELVK